MIKSIATGKIFLADQRGLQQTHSVRRWSTLNFGHFFDESKLAFDRLYFFNDDSLAPKQKTCFEIDRDSYVLILPITGAVSYLDDTENETDVDVEEAMVVFVEKGTNVTLGNSFDNEVINYLCLGIIADEVMPNNPQYFGFDLTEQNRLIQLERTFLPFKLSVGRFDGRNEHNYRLPSSSKVFYFVIAGVFEINGRLLHEKDGLALWETPEIEFEALSNGAVLVVIEME